MTIRCSWTFFAGGLIALAKQLDDDPGAIDRRFPEFGFGGGTGTRRLTLRGATLLHVAAEYGNVEAAKLFWIAERM